MMFRCLAIILTLSCATAASAGEKQKVAKSRACCTSRVLNFCCDDYIPKCAPKVKPNCLFVCDDYRPKCLPAAKPNCLYLCDDYCPKSIPRPTCPRRDFLKCAPPLVVPAKQK